MRPNAIPRGGYRRFSFRSDNRSIALSYTSCTRPIRSRSYRLVENELELEIVVGRMEKDGTGIEERGGGGGVSGSETCNVAARKFDCLNSWLRYGRRSSFPPRGGRGEKSQSLAENSQPIYAPINPLIKAGPRFFLASDEISLLPVREETNAFALLLSFSFRFAQHVDENREQGFPSNAFYTSTLLLTSFLVANFARDSARVSKGRGKKSKGKN